LSRGQLRLGRIDRLINWLRIRWFFEWLASLPRPTKKFYKAVLIIVTAIVGFAVFVNAVDYRVSPFNPPDSTVEIPISISYPANSTSFGNGTYNGLLEIGVGLHSTGPFVENKEVVMDAVGGINPKFNTAASTLFLSECKTRKIASRNQVIAEVIHSPSEHSGRAYLFKRILHSAAVSDR